VDHDTLTGTKALNNGLDSFPNQLLLFGRIVRKAAMREIFELFLKEEREWCWII
jgi:hypothetical protein